MSLLTKVAIGFLVFLTVIGFSAWSYVTKTYDDMVVMEESIKAQYENNKNIYSNMWKKFKEAYQINDKYAKDLESAYAKAISSRYGDGGSKAVFQVLQEQNPNLDPSSYNKMMVMIESGRNTFSDNQTLLIDKKRVYQQYLRGFIKRIVATSFGFPTIDLDKFGIVTDNRTEEAHKTGKDEEIRFE